MNENIENGHADQEVLKEIVTPYCEGIYEIGDLPETDLKDCNENDQELINLYRDVKVFWDSSKEFNPQGTPMPRPMSEYTARYIQSLAFQLEKALSPAEEEKPWNPNDDELLYNFSLLLRVNVPDTIKPIVDNTWDMLNQVQKRTLEENPEKKLLIRSFFTGSAVAEKELITQLDTIGQEKWAIVTTDIKNMSTAYSCINLSHLNSLLPEDKKFKIYITNHSIDEDIQKIINENDRSVIIQKGMAEEECCNSGDFQWDALLLDNGLPYVPKEAGSLIMEETAKSRNKDNGMAVNILGLDSNILVDIPDIEKYKEIFLGGNLFNKYPDLFNPYSPSNYPHKYEFKKEDDIYSIYKVYSYGAAMLFTLIRKNLTKSGTLKSLINHATGLSRAKSDVITSPFVSHLSMLEILDDQNIQYEELMNSLDHEVFGFERRREEGSWRFINKKTGQSYSAKEFYNTVKNIDPLVLRTSRFWVK